VKRRAKNTLESSDSRGTADDDCIKPKRWTYCPQAAFGKRQECHPSRQKRRNPNGRGPSAWLSIPCARSRAPGLTAALPWERLAPSWNRILPSPLVGGSDQAPAIRGTASARPAPGAGSEAEAVPYP